VRCVHDEREQRTCMIVASSKAGPRGPVRGQGFAQMPPASRTIRCTLSTRPPHAPFTGS
jgi:hypothetical protein